MEHRLRQCIQALATPDLWEGCVECVALAASFPSSGKLTATNHSSQLKIALTEPSETIAKLFANAENATRHDLKEGGIVLTDKVFYLVSFGSTTMGGEEEEEEVTMVVEYECPVLHLWKMCIFATPHGAVIELSGQAPGAAVFSIVNHVEGGISEGQIISALAQLPGISVSHKTEQQCSEIVLSGDSIIGGEVTHSQSLQSPIRDLSPTYAAFRSARRLDFQHHDDNPSGLPTLRTELAEVEAREMCLQAESSYRFGLQTQHFSDRLTIERNNMMREISDIETRRTSIAVPCVSAEVAEYLRAENTSYSHLGFSTFTSDGARELAIDHEKGARQKLHKYLTETKVLLLDKGRATHTSALKQTYKNMLNADAKLSEELRDKVRKLKTKNTQLEDSIAKLTDTITDLLKRQQTMVERARRREADLKELTEAMEAQRKPD